MAAEASDYFAAGDLKRFILMALHSMTLACQINVPNQRSLDPRATISVDETGNKTLIVVASPNQQQHQQQRRLQTFDENEAAETFITTHIIDSLNERIEEGRDARPQ
eukprot:scaffold12042_cov115-Cylindrotheca_fusiformis.AAC.3